MRYLWVKVVTIIDRANANIKMHIELNKRCKYTFIEKGIFGDNKCNVMIEGK